MPVLSNVPATAHTGASHRIRLVPHLDSRRSLRFDPITRDVVEGDAALRIGRFTERSGMGISQANALNSNKLAFKSKVVSRAHAEVWCELGGKFFIKDTKSSSGTFLNHVRLSPANQDSRPFELKDGDTLQLGVDYQGGTEDIYKCVRIRVEIGREWQASANAFKYVTFLCSSFFFWEMGMPSLTIPCSVPTHCASSNRWQLPTPLRHPNR
jgi:pSer/pThr/pTyr-binding forkhead associated (FHA) protein